MEVRAAFEQDQHGHHGEEPFIPPQPEAPPVRMPRVEDFPPIAQRQIEARQAPQPQEEDRGPLSLLRRLANVGLGRREEEAAPRQQPQAAPAPQAQQPRPKLPPPPAQRPAQPAQRPPQQVAAPPPPPSDYAKRPPAPRAAAPPDSIYRPRQAELDRHGRPVPRETRAVDDELEIPAFLRRQAN